MNLRWEMKHDDIYKLYIFFNTFLYVNWNTYICTTMAMFNYKLEISNDTLFP